MMFSFIKQGLIGIWNVTVLALHILLSQNDDIFKYSKWKQTIKILKIIVFECIMYVYNYNQEN